MGKTSRTPDAGQLRDQDSPQLEFPGTGKPDFRVYFTSEVHAHVARHAQENTSVEVGGVLVGNWYRDAAGDFVLVSEFIRCDAAASKSGEVTFTHEAWNVINREMDTRFTDLRIVGWYHTHPTFGIFLSERDTFIQDHFFSNPGQIAYVVDPVANTEGVFAWRRGKPALLSHYWVGDRICAGADQAAEPGPASAPVSPGRPQPAAAPSGEVSSLLGTVRWGLVYVAVFLVGYVLAATRSSWEQRMLIEGTVAHYGLWKGLRPGLGEHLDAAASGLDQVSAAVERLAKEHIQLAGEEGAEKKGQWDEVRGALRKTGEFLGQVKQRYALSPEESRIVAQILAAKQAELQGPSGGGAAATTAAKTATGAEKTAAGPTPPGGEANQQSPKTPAPPK
jgi:proteasome lid subunit RPN8/RPN11